jgi:hypothetical protein
MPTAVSLRAQIDDLLAHRKEIFRESAGSFEAERIVAGGPLSLDVDRRLVVIGNHPPSPNRPHVEVTELVNQPAALPLKRANFYGVVERSREPNASDAVVKLSISARKVLKHFGPLIDSPKDETEFLDIGAPGDFLRTFNPDIGGGTGASGRVID